MTVSRPLLAVFLATFALASVGRSAGLRNPSPPTTDPRRFADAMRRTTSFGERGLGRLDPLLFSARSRRLVNQLPPGAMVVADLGCGHEAAFLQRLAADRRLVTGIGLDLAVRDFPASSPIRTVVWDLNRPLPIPSCTVDAAVSLAVLEHLTEPLEFLREVRRILRPGGVLLLTTPTPAAPLPADFFSASAGLSVFFSPSVAGFSAVLDLAISCCRYSRPLASWVSTNSDFGGPVFDSTSRSPR